MDVFRRQATGFGTRFMTGAMSQARLGKRPFELVVDGKMVKAEAVIISLARRQSCSDLIGKTLDGLRRERTRHRPDGVYFKDKEAIVVGGRIYYGRGSGLSD